MNYSDIRGESSCLDQILIVIFVVLVIFVVIFFFKTQNNCINEPFKGKINYSEINDNNERNDMNTDNYLDYSLNNSLDNVENENVLTKHKFDEILIKKNDEIINKIDDISSNIEMKEHVNESDSETDKFLRRINNKYNHVKMENYLEPFTHLDNDVDNVDQESYHQTNNVNKLSSPENISGFLNGEQACNMNEQQKELVNDYKKKYFRMYRHQIECPKNCKLDESYNPIDGSCQFSNLKRCNLAENNDCQGIFTNDYNNPDVFSLGFLALDNNNKKSCVSCTSNDDRQTRNMKISNDGVNEEDEVKINERRLNNRNKFADFNDYIERNGVMETSVDKIAELRTCTTGTCGLNSYGKKVSDVYNNLLSTTYTDEKNKCNSGLVEGMNDSNSDVTYAQPL